MKEVYARFGLAYYHAECLHRTLAILHTFLRIGEPRHATGPRVEELIAEASWGTLGKAIHLIGAGLPEELTKRLHEALKTRNFRAHHFWYERIHMALTVDGVEGLVAELDAATTLFDTLDADLMSFIECHPVRGGIPGEALATAWGTILNGEPPDPLPRLRRPKRQENIVNAWRIPDAGALVFEAEDGFLFQLCDVGLGWTRMIRDDTWVPEPRIQPHLPATVRSRPAGAAGWNYALKLRERAELVVRPGDRPLSHHYTVVIPA